MKSFISNKNLSISAVVISLVALANSFWQSYLTESHNSLTIKPYLQASPRVTGDDSSGLYIENKGTGTAIISSAKISIRDAIYDLDNMRWTSIFTDLKLDPLCFRTSALKKGAAISAGNSVPLLTKTKADRALCELDVASFLANTNFELTINYMGLDNSRHQYRHNIGIQ